MGRQRIDASLAALARRRADLSSAHFGLAFMMTEADGFVASAHQAKGRLGMSVPKRQLKLAVDRNALKRVAREAWRLAPWGELPRPQVVMVKLRRSEAQWKTMGRAALKKAWRAELDELFSRLRRRVQSRSDAAVEAGAEAAAAETSTSPMNPQPTERRNG
ncbi:MAG: ribonuclease P protein component [Gammaproteobacteria bacterium]